MIITSNSKADYAAAELIFNTATSGIKSDAVAFISAHKRNAKTARAFLGLSKNSKMPAYTLAIPARESCPRGDKLAKVAGTVCEGCYAMKGHDAMTPAKTAKARRWDVVKLALKSQTIRTEWLDAFWVSMQKETHFRWHSAGDIFSPEYAELMREAIEATPWVDHWIPTRESRNAATLMDLNNAVVRVSDDMVNQTSNKHTGNTSGVHTADNGGRGEACNAPNQGGQCLDCRACWSSDVAHISYAIH